MNAMRLVVMAWFVLILIGAIWILMGCGPAPTNVYTTNQAPQSRCETYTVTGINNCVFSANCPYPNRLCETFINNTTLVYSCNPVLYSTQQVCR